MAVPNPVDYGPEPKPGRVLKLLIEASDRPYGEIAALMGWSKSMLSERISGATRIQADEMNKLARIFGVEPGIFFRQPMDLFGVPKTGYLSQSGSRRKSDLTVVKGEGRGRGRTHNVLLV